MIQILFAKPSQRPSKLPKTASLPNIHQYRDAARIFANGTQDLQVQSSLGFSEPEHQAQYIIRTVQLLVPIPPIDLHLIFEKLILKNQVGLT